MRQAEQKNQEHPTHAEGIFHTLEWVITAITLTIIFIVFEMQAYTIPTGSMADTLRGAHFRLRCHQCGYRFDYDFSASSYRMVKTTKPNQDIPIMPANPRCPSCGYFMKTADRMPDGNYRFSRENLMPVTGGDRIFVLKCIYQFTEPKQWDVVVFKNPQEPQINYIKRMIARPGETLQIIDGDIYIDGRISRKPPKIQQELWMPVYDNNYQPVNPNIKRFNGRTWQQPFKNTAGSNWNLSGDNPTIFTLDSAPDNINTITYDTAIGNDFKATYAYDNSGNFPAMPICSDLMVRFYADTDGSPATIGAEITKYHSSYKATVDLTGRMTIEKIADGQIVELAGTEFDPAGSGDAVLFKFANVDHQLILEFGKEKLKYDLGTLPQDAGQPASDSMPQASIFAAGKLKLSNIAIFRDIHYISSSSNGIRITQARDGQPFTLGADEFFVLGDNTPASADSRFWSRDGIGNNGTRYRQGTVPRDYLVGKAFIVYWPGPSKPFENFKVIPYVDGIKTIAGGSNKKL